MANQAPVMEYKCPCCDAGLTFGGEEQRLKCDSCGNEFDLEAVSEYNNTTSTDEPDFQWEDMGEDREPLPYQCPSCGGLIDYDDHTASTFCPYCDNPVVLPERVSAAVKPDAVIPFKTTREQAQENYKQLCKKKLLLPKDFLSQQQINSITGYYVPFWLYNCGSTLYGKYRATRVHTWSDSHYIYTRTDYFLLTRSAKADFSSIPMDGSTKMDNAIMESIEPYNYTLLADFDPAYLSGFFTDKYDVEAKLGEERIRQRVSTTMDLMIARSCVGYNSVIPTGKDLKIKHSKAKYVLLPVWILTTKYKGKTYTFAMNGQTGKMTGTFPICPKRSAAWFAGITAAVTALVTALQWLAL